MFRGAGLVAQPFSLARFAFSSRLTV